MKAKAELLVQEIINNQGNYEQCLKIAEEFLDERNRCDCGQNDTRTIEGYIKKILTGTPGSCEGNNERIIKAIEEIILEYKSSSIKHVPMFRSTHEGYAVIKEELEELWEDVKSDNLEHSQKEAKQIGAMALKYIISFGG